MVNRTPESDRILADLQELRRSPFKEVLRECLSNPPSGDAWAKQAEKSPDRWSQAVSILAKASGYASKSEVEGDISLNRKLDNLSDMEMHELIRQNRIDAVKADPDLYAELLREAKELKAPAGE